MPNRLVAVSHVAPFGVFVFGTIVLFAPISRFAQRNCRRKFTAPHLADTLAMPGFSSEVSRREQYMRKQLHELAFGGMQTITFTHKSSGLNSVLPVIFHICKQYIVTTTKTSIPSTNIRAERSDERACLLQFVSAGIALQCSAPANSYSCNQFNSRQINSN